MSSKKQSLIARHPWRFLTICVMTLFVGVVAYAATTSYISARRALNNVSYVERHLTLITTTAGREALQAHLHQAHSELVSAQSSFSTFGLLPASEWVPYFGGEIEGTQKLLSDAGVAVTTGSHLVHVFSTVVAAGPQKTLSAPRLEQLETDVAQSVTTLTGLQRPVGSLFGPVGANRAAFDRKVDHATNALKKLGAGLILADAIFGHSSSQILVLPENNAEMRDQGAILSYALLSVHGSNIHEVSTGDTSSVVAPHPLAVPASGGTRAFFYGNGANQDLRFVNATADFSWSGGTSAAIFQAATGIRVNTVVALDVPTMASLLKVTGPLYVPSAHVVLNQGNFATYVLHDLYLDYPVGSQGPRKAELSEIASLLLQRIKGSAHNQFEFLRSLASDIPGRHLLVWNRDPKVESAIVALGASGKIANVDPGATFHLAVESAVAAKLDYFVHVSQSIHVMVNRDGSANVTTEVTETNTAPRGQKPSYALGPDGLNAKVPGEYVSNTYLWSPAGSVVVGGKQESGLVLTGTSVVVMPQSSAHAYFSTFLPHAIHSGRLTLRLVPQGRLDPIETKILVSYQGKHQQGQFSSSLRLSTPVTVTYSLVS